MCLSVVVWGPYTFFSTVSSEGWDFCTRLSLGISVGFLPSSFHHRRPGSLDVENPFSAVHTLTPSSSFISLPLSSCSFLSFFLSLCLSLLFLLFSLSLSVSLTPILGTKAASHLSQQELYELRTRLRTPPFSEDSIVKTVMAHTDIVKRLYEEFQVRRTDEMEKRNEEGEIRRSSQPRRGACEVYIHMRNRCGTSRMGKTELRDDMKRYMNISAV